MENILSGEYVNRGRQKELDIARGLAVLFMIAVHTLLDLSKQSVQSTTLGGVISFLGGAPAAPVFMFLLGVGIIYTRKSDPIDYIKRGILIFLSGYILNIFRESLPQIVTWIGSGDAEYLNDSLAGFAAIDILHFAGLAMIFFGLVKLIKPNNIMMAVTGFFFALINFLMMEIEIKNDFINAVTGLFWGSSHESYFPFLTWILYPIAGYIFGSMLIRCTNKLKFYSLALGTSAIIYYLSSYVFVWILDLDIGMETAEGYYHHTLFGNIVFIAFTIGWISILFLVSNLIKGIAYKTIERWSQNVTEIFFIHWCIIGWTKLITGYNSLDLPQYLLVFVLITITSDFLAHVYKKWKKEKSQTKQSQS